MMIINHYIILYYSFVVSPPIPSSCEALGANATEVGERMAKVRPSGATGALGMGGCQDAGRHDVLRNATLWLWLTVCHGRSQP